MNRCFLKQCCRRKPNVEAVKILQLVQRKPPGKIYSCSEHGEREPNIYLPLTCEIIRPSVSGDSTKIKSAVMCSINGLEIPLWDQEDWEENFNWVNSCHSWIMIHYSRNLSVYSGNEHSIKLHQNLVCVIVYGRNMIYLRYFSLVIKLFYF